MPDQPLAAPADVVGMRGAPFPASVLRGAGEAVRTVAGWHIAPSVETTVKVRTSGRVVLLPSLYVTAVASITDRDGRAIDGWDWLPEGIVERDHGRFPRIVTVTFTHGYAKVPADLLSIISETAGASTHGRVRSESLMSRSVTLAADADPVIAAVLARYRLVRGA